MISAQDCLADLLQGEPLTLSDLDELIQLSEGQHLEFKDGAITSKQKRRHGAEEIRKTINAFANSNGGILVVGVTDPSPRAVSPCHGTGTEPIDKWAEDLIHDMTPWFSPLPRFQVLEHSQGSVLVVAVPRAPRLVPIVRAGELRYFLRINQSTVEAPAYLISDLVLGRRRHPTIDTTLDGIGFQSNPASPVHLTAYIDVVNESLVHVDDIRVGMVAWGFVPPNQQPALSRSLRSYVALGEQPDSIGESPTWRPIHLRTQSNYPDGGSSLPPFVRRTFRTTDPYPVSTTAARIHSAVYVLPRGSDPIWYEGEYRLPNPLDNLHGRLAEATMRPALDRRPRVSWSPDPGS